MNSQILYFQRTTPQMEQIFNSYMDEAVMLYNEEWTAEILQYGVVSPMDLAISLARKWYELVRDN